MEDNPSSLTNRRDLANGVHINVVDPFPEVHFGADERVQKCRNYAHRIGNS